MTNDDRDLSMPEGDLDQEYVDKLRTLHATIGEMIEEMARLLDNHEEAVTIEPVPAVNDMPIHDLDLDRRGFNLLMRYDIRTVGKLVTYSDDELLRLKGIGDATVKNIVEALAAQGYALKRPYLEEDEEE